MFYPNPFWSEPRKYEIELLKGRRHSNMTNLTIPKVEKNILISNELEWIIVALVYSMGFGIAAGGV